MLSAKLASCAKGRTIWWNAASRLPPSRKSPSPPRWTRPRSLSTRKIQGNVGPNLMPSWVVPLFVIVASVSLFVQMLIFGAMFLEFRRINRRLEQIADDLQRRINPVISRLQMLVEEAQPRISGMISDAAEITHVARSQVQRVDRMVTEAVDRLRMQLVHADQILTGAMETVEETG